MAQMNVSIPDQLKGWAERRVADGRYSSTSDYVRDLIRRDEAAELRREADVERLRALWDEGIASGEPRPFTPDIVEDIIARGRKRAVAE